MLILNIFMFKWPEKCQEDFLFEDAQVHDFIVLGFNQLLNWVKKLAESF